jgi:hypothetical protein
LPVLAEVLLASTLLGLLGRASYGVNEYVDHMTAGLWVDASEHSP